MKFCSVAYLNYSVKAEGWEHRSKTTVRPISRLTLTLSPLSSGQTPTMDWNKLERQMVRSGKPWNPKGENP